MPTIYFLSGYLLVQRHDPIWNNLYPVLLSKSSPLWRFTSSPGSPSIHVHSSIPDTCHPKMTFQNSSEITRGSLVLGNSLSLFLFFFLALPTTCGSSQARDQTHTIAVTQAAALAMLILNPLHQKRTPDLYLYFTIGIIKKKRQKCMIIRKYWLF